MYPEHDFHAWGQRTPNESRRRGHNRRSFLVAGTAAAAAAALAPVALAQTKFRRISTQFIAALGAEDATSGDNAQSWGLWSLDPGPRGVRLNRYEQLKAAGGVAPANWQFDNADWWLEEHGLIMEQPKFPLPAGQYLVTGDRATTAALTVHAADSNGNRRWELADGATLYDVTHLGCRSARYTPAAGNNSCSPAKAQQSSFPVVPGGVLPPVEGCNKLDYAVLFVIGMAA
jgi:hypothetical protein